MLIARRRRVALPVAAALALVPLSCGVPLQDGATELPADRVPYGLAVPASTTTTTTTTGETAAIVYLVAEDGLVPVRRTFASTPGVATLIDALTASLSADEAARGLRRALADRELLDTVEATGDLATVELTDEFSLLPSREQLLALGQVVLTLTQLERIDRVRFTLDQEPLSVPTATGSVSSSPVRSAEYEPLLL